MIADSVLQASLIDLTLKLFPDPIVFPDEARDSKIDWLIVPEKSTYMIPYELLQFRYESDTTTYHFLGELVNMTYAPSLSSYVEFAQNPQGKKQNKSVLLISANPNIQTAENYVSNLFALRGNYGALNFVDQEIKAIKEVFSKKSLFRRKFRVKIFDSSTISEENLKSINIEEYQYIHIASHGVHDESDPLYSGILLGNNPKSSEDGLLQAHEIYPYNLNADIVTLSSCFSGFGELDPNEGNMGIYRSFLIAGAKSVIISLWNVEDESTSILFSKFYEFMDQGKTKAESLRMAKMYLKNETRFSHPFYWAPFILMGES